MADENQEPENEKPIDGQESPTEETPPPPAPTGIWKYLGFLSFFSRFYSAHKMLSFLIIGLLVLIIGGGVTYYILFRPQPAEEEQSALLQSPTFYALPELKITTKHSDESVGYLVIGLTLKLSPTTKLEDYKKREPEILDLLHTFLASISLDSLNNSSASLTSSVGLERLRENMIRRLNTVLAPLKVETILYRKLITQ